jgi:hypothetical protein
MSVTFYEVLDAHTILSPLTFLHLYSVLAEPAEPLTIEEHPGVVLGQQQTTSHLIVTSVVTLASAGDHRPIFLSVAQKGTDRTLEDALQ